MINTNATLKERYVIHSFVRQSDLAFYSFFHNSMIQNQRLNMMYVMEFDYLNRFLQREYRDALIEKRDFFAFLCQDQIDLEELFTRSQRLVDRRDNMEKHLHRIFRLNSGSKTCM